MFDKIFKFLVSIIVINGLLAIFVASFFYIILAIIFAFAMIPVSVIVGNGVANQIMDFVGNNIGYRGIYIIVFALMALDDLGVPNIKTLLKKRLKK